MQNYRFNRGIPNSILTSFGVGTRTGAAELTSDYSWGQFDDFHLFG